ncbi:isopenicillin N synthase family dioxygenase [Kordiimonas aquimaris]|uniref:isopenicillin N synthase family dioxygenase n=1 Tax=Kordiimonas aquimaris TaxID=707591 RepID=UPI0021D08DC0|nr:2OG-Fe(II) oxygenase family protein [Kordiimonas aquimaris]
MTEKLFDAEAKENELRTQSYSWDTSTALSAEDGDIPIVDVAEYLRTGSRDALKVAAETLRGACETVGFYQLAGHGVDRKLINNMFAAVRAFHALPLATKQQIILDRPDWPLRGIGYMPVGERRFPRREKGNLNEAFLIKSAQGISFDDNQWLAETDLPGFRGVVEEYANALTTLARSILPVYAVALGLEPDFFAPGFTHPFWRLRMTHYPPFPAQDADQFGIAPHVDTTFFTLLLQDSPGLTIFSEKRKAWIKAPVIEGAFVVNSGELLKQWSNDRFVSTKHFANTDGTASRYSIPFFFNANADYPMACLPTCCGPDNPPKYPTVSYQDSQAAAQGE